MKVIDQVQTDDYSIYHADGRDAQNYLENRPRHFPGSYMPCLFRTWFVVDLVSCIPFNDVAGSESLDRLFAMKLLKLGKLLKLNNLLKLDRITCFQTPEAILNENLGA